MSKTKFIINNAGVIFGVLAVASVVAYAAAWQEPTAPAPGDNTEAPLNVGSSNQVKSGGLGVGPLSVFGSAYIQGNLGVGVSLPAFKIDASGDINTAGVYRKDGTKAGITLSCASGSGLQNLEISGGIITSGTCAAAPPPPPPPVVRPTTDFGGMFSIYHNGTSCSNKNDVNTKVPNPYTGDVTCPAGYTETLLSCAAGETGNRGWTSYYYCRKDTGAVAAGTADFAGMFSTNHNNWRCPVDGKTDVVSRVNNPYTGALSCPSGYTEAREQCALGDRGAFGASDYYYCYKNTGAVASGAADFGGMFSVYHNAINCSGTEANPAVDVLSPVGNPYTGGLSCPSGYTTKKLDCAYGEIGETGATSYYFCYKP